MISDLFTITTFLGILASGIRLATPYLFASIGEMFSQRPLSLLNFTPSRESAGLGFIFLVWV